MEKQYSVQFFSSFVEAMQKLCREYLDFDQGVELSGYLAVEIDNFKKERYVLSELIQSTGHVISESYCTKAFKTHRKDVSYGTENQAPQANRFSSRVSSQGPDYSLGNNQDRVSSRTFSSIRPRPRQNFSHHRKPVRTSIIGGSRINETISLIDDSNSGNQFGESAGSQEQDVDQSHVSHDSSFPSQQASMSDTPQAASHSLTASPLPSTPLKRSSSAVEDDFPSNKKDKLDSSLDALYDAAKDIASSAQSDIDSMSSNYPMSKFTRTAVSGSETISTAAPGGQTSTAQSGVGDSVRMPLVVKEEKPDDVPYMVLDDPNVLDPEVHVKTLDKTMFNSEHDNSQTFSLDGATSFSSDMPSASTSFAGLQDSMHSGNAADGGASWDNQVAEHSNMYCQSQKLTGGTRYKCNECTKTFTFHSALTRHMRTVHAKSKCLCRVCGKQFSRNSNLNIHTQQQESSNRFGRKCSFDAETASPVC
ncbi:zinc finger protein 81-like isoform X7 [Gigantopelta aegis]|uniref:zinc finger protein 81-like isoform X7 n=1 Tax=Gigantopelta aegis TaxID=1735272 RepID=UPI001B88C2D8|nr:zinc finger protein 81-like isoform X7 [Gigantopelta aegis]